MTIYTQQKVQRTLTVRKTCVKIALTVSYVSKTNAVNSYIY